MAAEEGHLEVVRLLVKSGADCDANTSDGETAGDLALRFGHEDVYRFLTEFGATPPPGKVRRVGER
jgi:ankyrin repeat protein